ncbi:MAG: hypothetical protein LUG83_08655 [Lachnospiraceae bacterium]|nr:hypothetical protein [Lachnospiraceae bacterium]
MKSWREKIYDRNNSGIKRLLWFIGDCKKIRVPDGAGFLWGILYSGLGMAESSKHDEGMGESLRSGNTVWSGNT